MLHTSDRHAHTARGIAVFGQFLPARIGCFIVSFVLPTATVLNDSCPPAYLINLSASRSNLARRKKLAANGDFLHGCFVINMGVAVI